MDLLMLLDEMCLRFEDVHSLRKFWKYMAFFDGVVDSEGLTEVEALRKELAERHARRTRASATSLVEDVPGIAKVVVVSVHHFCKFVVRSKISSGELR